MSEAIKAKDLKTGDRYDGRRQVLQKGIRREQAGSAFEGVAFGDLTAKQKDDLLKEVAIKLGILEDQE